MPIHSQGFSPISRVDARVLILGTLPGTVSLESNEYYAHPRNAFWPIMGKIMGASPHLSYADRKKLLIEKGIALWDVCATAVRPGSLDTSIDPSTVVPNDFSAFFHDHPHIHLICFSSARASEMYVRKVLPNLPPVIQSIRREVLQSPSPARTISFEKKLAQWRNVLNKSVIANVA